MAEYAAANGLKAVLYVADKASQPVHDLFQVYKVP